MAAEVVAPDRAGTPHPSSLSAIPGERWPALVASERQYYRVDAPGKQLLALLAMLRDVPSHGYPVNLYRHSLQTATRCYRELGDETLAAVALLHDIGEAFSDENHGAVAAAIMKPFVEDRVVWMLEHHPVFQEFYYAGKLGRDPSGREAFRGHPHFQFTLDFCERWDEPAFDPAFVEMPLEAFAPMVHRLFAGEASAGRGGRSA